MPATKRRRRPALSAGQPLLPRQVLAEDFSLLVFGMRRLMDRRSAKSTRRPEVRH